MAMDAIISVYKISFHLNRVSKGILGSLLILLICSTFLDLQPLLNQVSTTSNYTKLMFWSNLSRLKVGLKTNHTMINNRNVNYDHQGCDLLDGSWIHDEANYPLYRSQDCPFIDEAFRCQENGRPDKDYMKWRWQPSKCNLPRCIFVYLYPNSSHFVTSFMD